MYTVHVLETSASKSERFTRNAHGQLLKGTHFSCCSRLRLLDLSRSCRILLYITRRSSQKEGGSCWYAGAGWRPCASLLLLLLLLSLLLLLLLLALTMLDVLHWVTQEDSTGLTVAVVLHRAAAVEPTLLWSLSNIWQQF
jgi:hypothetical protein